MPHGEFVTRELILHMIASPMPGLLLLRQLEKEELKKRRDATAGQGTSQSLLPSLDKA